MCIITATSTCGVLQWFIAGAFGAGSAWNKKTCLVSTTSSYFALCNDCFPRTNHHCDSYHEVLVTHQKSNSELSGSDINS